MGKSPDRVPGNEYSTEFREKWGRMAKICLSPEEVALLQKTFPMCQNLNSIISIARELILCCLQI